MLILGLLCQGSGVLEGSGPVFSETRAQLLHKKIRVSKTGMENMKADSGPQEVTALSTSCPGRDGGSASKVRPGTEFNSSWLCHLRGLERNSAALSPSSQCQQSRFSMIADTFPFKTVPKGYNISVQSWKQIFPVERSQTGPGEQQGTLFSQNTT